MSKVLDKSAFDIDKCDGKEVLRLPLLLETKGGRIPEQPRSKRLVQIIRKILQNKKESEFLDR